MEKYRSLPQKSIDQINGFILAFGLDDEDSLKNVSFWNSNIKTDIPKILIGN